MSAIPANTKIIETSCNRFYIVTEPTDPAVSHCYIGVEIKRTRKGNFVEKANSRIELVRKAATRVVVLTAAFDGQPVDTRSMPREA